jgi:SAM-dependent methyltransferase
MTQPRSGDRRIVNLLDPQMVAEAMNGPEGEKVVRKHLRAREIAKYSVAYSHSDYRMGAERRAFVERQLAGGSGSLLDVGTGRGETLDIALAAGYSPVLGTEVVRELLHPGAVVYAEAHALPFDDHSFDIVTCFDVLEHLLHDDQAPALRELCRVARRAVIVTAATFSHVFDGVELHPGRREIDEWDALIRAHCPGPVSRIGWCGTAEGWRVDLT